MDIDWCHQHFDTLTTMLCCPALLKVLKNTEKKKTNKPVSNTGLFC